MPSQLLSVPSALVGLPRQLVGVPRARVGLPFQRVFSPQNVLHDRTESACCHRDLRHRNACCGVFMTVPRAGLPRQLFGVPSGPVGLPRQLLGVPRARVGLSRQLVGVSSARVRLPRQLLGLPWERVGLPFEPSRLPSAVVDLPFPRANVIPGRATVSASENHRVLLRAVQTPAAHHGPPSQPVLSRRRPAHPAFILAPSG